MEKPVRLPDQMNQLCHCTDGETDAQRRSVYLEYLLGLSPPLQAASGPSQMHICMGQSMSVARRLVEGCQPCHVAD